MSPSEGLDLIKKQHKNRSAPYCHPARFLLIRLHYLQVNMRQCVNECHNYTQVQAERKQPWVLISAGWQHSVCEVASEVLVRHSCWTVRCLQPTQDKSWDVQSGKQGVWAKKTVRALCSQGPANIWGSCQSWENMDASIGDLSWKRWFPGCHTDPVALMVWDMDNMFFFSNLQIVGSQSIKVRWLLYF